jgi:hypothetical protein
LTAGTTEKIDLCVEDVLGPTNSAEFFIEVKGFGNAVNDYDLFVNGNAAYGGATPVVSSGTCTT